MAPPLNRTAILLDLTAFVGVSVFCIITQAPLIQQDILKRSQDALLTHRIQIRGLAVDGRDVVLNGTADAAIASVRAQRIVEEVAGVRRVRIEVLEGTQANSPGSLESGLESATEGQQKDVQAKIDSVLENQSITFQTDSAVLTAESEAVLNKIIVYLKETPNLACEIRGYNSQPRGARQDWVMAFQRALATEDYLEARGIADWRLSTRAFQTGEGGEVRRTDRVVDLVVRAK